MLAQHPADRLDPEAGPIGVDVGDDQRSRRSSYAAAKNAEAVFRISLARRSSAFSLRKAASSAAVSVVVPGLVPESSSARSAQPRSVAGLTSSSSPTRREAAAGRLAGDVLAALPVHPDDPVPGLPVVLPQR